MNFDCYAITTWPGYCFQTALCIRSILEHFPLRPIHIIVDTEHHTGYPVTTPWPDFESDLKQYIADQHFKADIVWHTVGQVPAINQCPVGWWRQQLVKLCLDQYLPGDSWLIIDADIIFDQPLTFDQVPVKVDRHRALETDSITLGNRLYVKYLLGTDVNSITCNNLPACASAVPFRQLDRKLLIDLRNHVEQIHQQDFVEMHIKMFESQQIVGYDPKCQSMVMSEFELVEVYRHMTNPLPFRAVHWDHTFTIECTGDYRFRHSSLSDWAIGREWLQAQHLQISDALWQKSKQFQENMPHLRK